MARRKPPVYVDVAPDVLARLSEICAGLPETVKQQSWGGTRWRIRQGTFAEVTATEEPGGPVTILRFCAEGEELEYLFTRGHPFMKAAWGDDVVWMLIEDDVDWDEVRELLTDSYCLFAPKKLAAAARPES